MKKTILFLMAASVLFLFSCSSSTPLEKLKNKLADYPEYSIILEDMKVDGNFFKEYYHRYKSVVGVQEGDSLRYVTDLGEWSRVEERDFRDYSGYLGMVIASKSADGKVSEDKYPPGYQYVGNPQYGRWRSDSGGNSFWEFYGKYALMSQLFGFFGRPVYRNDWNDYRGYRNSGRPYYGRNNQYGTNGSYTKKSNPTFFQRRQAQEQMRKQSFGQKVKQRARRSNMSSYRKRSGGFGK